MSIDPLLKRSLGTDALFQYLGTGVQVFAGLIFYIGIARMFNTSEVGVISLLVAIIGLFNVLFSLGMSTAAQHYISFSLGEGNLELVPVIVRKITSYTLLSAFSGAVILYVFAPLISFIFLHNYIYINLIRILSLVLLETIIYGIFNGFLLGLEKFKDMAIVNIIIWSLYYFTPIVLSFLDRNLITIIVGWLIGITIGVGFELFLLMKFFVRKTDVHLGKNKQITVLHYSLPILFGGLVSYGAVYADRFIVSSMLAVKYLGIYNYSLLFVSAIGFVAVPFNNILMTKFSSLFAKGDIKAMISMANISISLLSLFYIPLALFTFVIAPYILQILAGHEYLSAVLPLRIILAISSLFVSRYVLSQIISSIKKTRVFVYSSGTALIFNIILSLFLIPRISLLGAAIGFSSVYVISFIIFSIIVRKSINFNIEFNSLYKIWASALMMLFILFIENHIIMSISLLLPIDIFSSIVTYFLLIKLLKPYNKEKSDIILSLIPENLRSIKRLITYLISN